jgi:hypothetical protein
MGMSRFSEGKFDLIVVADHSLDVQSKVALQAMLLNASEALYDATEGQLCLGDIHIADENWGLGAAEMVLHADEGRAFATIGGYGIPGQKMHLFTDSDHKTLVHEFGHHAFGLYDEYVREVITDQIDREASEPAEYATELYREVPLQGSEHDEVEDGLANEWAVLRFGNQLREAIINSHTPNLLTVYGSFPDNPMTQTSGPVAYHRRTNISCAAPTSPAPVIHSIMDNSHDPVVTEFCTSLNHNLLRNDDPDLANSHTTAYGGLSCWEVIRNQMLDRWDHPLAIPESQASSGPNVTPDYSYPSFYDLVKEGRFVLVMDRSGSMTDDGKILGAKYGVEVWLQVMKRLGDYLSVIWYDESIDVRLPLTEIQGTTDVQTLIDTTNDVLPQGYTNIRDALYAAHGEITSRPNRAAIQGVILLTDGIHNRPVDTSALEVVPTFQDAGIPILGIAMGAEENVDTATLQTLCSETGGVLQVAHTFPNYEPADDASVRGTAGIQVGQAHALLRNGASVYGDLEIGSEGRVASAMSKPGKSSTKLRRLADIFGLANADELLRRRAAPGTGVVRFHVEEGADYAMLTAIYREKEALNIVLIDPDGHVVEYDNNQRIFIESDSPIRMALVKKPKPGYWRAILLRTIDGEPFTVFYNVEVDNRRITVHGTVDPWVDVGQAVMIRASGNWKDILSDLDVTARIRDPHGGVHTVMLSDTQHGEPNSGEYVGLFVAPERGRYTVDLTIANRGKAIVAGGMHRLMHGRAGGRAKPETIDISSDAPVFIRRIPLFFDVGQRLPLVDLDDRSGGKLKVPVQPPKTKSKPLNIQRALKRAKHIKEATEKTASTKTTRTKKQSAKKRKIK